MTPSHDRVHRAIGALVGLAVGDALGAPFEFQPGGTYRRRFPEPVVGGIGEMVGGGPWGPGEFTDDTQMAVMVAESLLERDGVDQADLGERFRAWVQSGPKDVGIATRSVLTADADPVTAAAEYFARNRHNAAGNGSLMRTIPAAIRFAGDGTEATMAAARSISVVTHGDPAAGEGCAIYHELVRRALEGGDPIAAIPQVLELVDDDQRDRYEECLAEVWQPTDGPPNGSVWGALATAIWAIRHADSFEQAVVRAIDCGNDADTVGAITGGLAGAIWGIGRIPSRWTTYVHGSVLDWTFGLADLQDLARRLVGAKPVSLQADEPVLERVEVADGVWVANLPGARGASTEMAVVSLCRPKGYFADHPVRREVYLVDQEVDHNPALDEVVDDIIRSMVAFRTEGRDVVVHCHGGRSRTGLVLRAWLQQHHGLGYDAALVRAQEVWPHTATYNESFEDLLRQMARP